MHAPSECFRFGLACELTQILRASENFPVWNDRFGCPLKARCGLTPVPRLARKLTFAEC